MKLPKQVYYILLLLIFALIEYNIHLNVYIILALYTLSFFVLNVFIDNENEVNKKKENRELQEEVKSTAKDAHLKNKQLITIVSSIPFPMLLMDQFGNIVMHNNIQDLFAQTYITEQMTYMNNPFYHEIREFIKDTFILEKAMDKILHIHHIEYQAMSIPVMAKGKYSGCLILFQDISKTLEGEKMQKRFIADASHELKTPIAVLKGMIEILNREDFDDPITQKEFLTQMDLEIKRLESLVKDLLQLSRLSLSSVILERQKCDLCTLIDDAVKSLQKVADKKGLHIIKDYQCNELVFCDPKKMTQVMLNLISNAIKYSDQGNITLRTYQERSWFMIDVQDEGCGIKEEDQHKIYERFYRVDDDRCRKSGGSGLGLPIVRSIMEAHGGTIEVESTYGKGSTFRVKLKN